MIKYQMERGMADMMSLAGCPADPTRCPALVRHALLTRVPRGNAGTRAWNPKIKGLGKVFLLFIFLAAS